MEQFQGRTLSWETKNGVIELALHREPANEIGSVTTDELEKFVGALDVLKDQAHAVIIYSTLKAGFSAGADLRELYRRMQQLGPGEVAKEVRTYLGRIHHVMNSIDSSPLTTIAAVHE